LRFVTEGKFIRLHLSALEADTAVTVYCGDWVHSRHTLRAGVVTSLFLEDPPFFSQVTGAMLKVRRFAPQVWRVTFHQDAIVLYHHLDAFGHTVRPPQHGEIPALTWLAYGSSITFGGNAFHAPNAYLLHAAERLGVDVLNKGLPGSCFCEAPMAEYLAGLKWDFATLELGVNLAELATPEEFKTRAVSLIDKLHNQHLDRAVFVVDIYPNRADYTLSPSDPAAQNNPRFREILRRHVAEKNHPSLRHLEAKAILDDLTGLSVDLLHPSDAGHLQMGERLAALLQASLTKLSKSP
jgi:hypothetical protein